MPIPTDTFWNIKRLNIWFAISGVLMMAVTGAAIMQDYNQGWREPQRSGKVWDAAFVNEKLSGENSGGRLAMRAHTATNLSAGTFITRFEHYRTKEEAPIKRPTSIRNDGTRYTWSMSYDPDGAGGHGLHHGDPEAARHQRARQRHGHEGLAHSRVGARDEKACFCRCFRVVVDHVVLRRRMALGEMNASRGKPSVSARRSPPQEVAWITSYVAGNAPSRRRFS